LPARRSSASARARSSLLVKAHWVLNETGHRMAGLVGGTNRGDAAAARGPQLTGQRPTDPSQ
jgi:hypothetical protein